MGCGGCRGARRRRQDNSGLPPECKRLEDGGARTVVIIKATQQGPRLVVATERNGFMDLGSFLSAFGCSGPTASLLRRNWSTIQQALAQQPQLFSQRSGTNLTDLIRTAERVVKGARANVPKKKIPRQIPPHF